MGGAGGVGGAGGSSGIESGGSGQGATGGTVGVVLDGGGETGGVAGAAEVDENSACAKWSVSGQELPSILQLVIDTSISMNDRPPAGGPTKWEVTRSALSKALDALPPNTAVGVLFYPNEDSTGSATAADVSTCVAVDRMIPIALLGDKGSNQRTVLSDALNAVQPIGYTPTHDAYHYALTESLERTSIEGTRYMLLFTDGAPTLSLGCVGTDPVASPAPTQPIIDEIQAAHDQGVRTFLIGAPGTEVSVDGTDARRWLSQAARAGGTATDGCSDDGPDYCHIDLSESTDFKGALTQGLANVAGQIIPCSYALPTAPPGQVLDTDNINVYYSTADGSSPNLIRRNQSASCTDGWQLASEQIVLCPATCMNVRATADATVKLLFGCASVVEPR